MALSPPRWMRLAWLILGIAGGVFITVLATASANSALFTRYYTELLVANALIVAGLAALVIYQVVLLLRARRDAVFGAKLTTRMMMFFAVVAVLPGALVYGISVQFLASSIELFRYPHRQGTGNWPATGAHRTQSAVKGSGAQGGDHRRRLVRARAGRRSRGLAPVARADRRGQRSVVDDQWRNDRAGHRKCAGFATSRAHGAGAASAPRHADVTAVEPSGDTGLQLKVIAPVTSATLHHSGC
jgi:hypothetical protein